MSILSRRTNLIRHTVPDLSKVCTGVDSVKVSQQCRAISGDHDLDDVRDAMIARYAQVIVAVKDERTGTIDSNIYRQSSQLKLDYAASQAIMAGQQEVVRLYLYNTITRQRATLFSETTQRYEYESPDVGEVMADVRDDGSANICAQRWDTYADAIGSCALYISDSGGELSYQEIPPHRIWFAHSESINDGGTDRATNTEDLDEATVVAIELAWHDNTRRFCAWFGPSDLYEDGRQVVYDATEWTSIPPVGSEKALEYSASAGALVRAATDPANPLTLISRSQDADSVPVYPIAFLYGDSMQRGLMPTSSSLYSVAAELDLMGSMIIGSAGRGARGMRVFKRGEDPNIPDNMSEGDVLIGRGQDLGQGGWPASHSKDAMDVINNFMRHIAEVYSVPGLLVSADQPGDMPSGVALELMMLPLTRCRNARIELNRHSVRRRFAIERAIINGAIGTTTIPWDERETWIPGERAWPQDKEATIRTWQQRISLGEADLGDVVQELRGLKTHEEAINWLGERKAVRKEYEEILKNAAAPAPAAKASLAERLRGGGGVAAGQQWHREPGPRPEIG